MANNLTINAEYVGLASAFCAGTSALRYYLKGVRVEPHPSGDGVLIIATDGYIACVFYDREGYADRDYLLELDKPLITALKAGKETPDLLLTIVSDRLTVVGQGGREYHIKPNNIEIDGTFPEWRRVFPTEYTCESGLNIDASKLKPFIAVAKALTFDSKVQLTASKKGDLISCRIGHDDFTGVIMSVRGNEGLPTASWLSS